MYISICLIQYFEADFQWEWCPVKAKTSHSPDLLEPSLNKISRWQDANSDQFKQSYWIAYHMQPKKHTCSSKHTFSYFLDFEYKINIWFPINPAVQFHYYQFHGWSSKFPKSWTLENQYLKPAVCLQNIKNSKLNGQIPLDKLKLNQKKLFLSAEFSIMRL